jgi:hypothetical protein
MDTTRPSEAPHRPRKTKAESSASRARRRQEVRAARKLPRPDILDLIPRPGRPTLYHPAWCEKAKRLKMAGLTDEEIAEHFFVSHDTLESWKCKHPEFAGAIREGGTDADANVAYSLYRRATGFRVKAVKILPGYQGGEPVYAPYMEYHPPDTRAIVAWLTNRRRRDWQTRQQVEHTGAIEAKIEQMSPDQRYARLTELLVKAGVLELDDPEPIEGEYEELPAPEGEE